MIEFSGTATVTGNSFLKQLRFNRKGSTKVIALVIIAVVVIALVSLAVYYYNAYHNLTFELEDAGLGNLSMNSVTLNMEIAVGNPNFLPVYIPSGSFIVYVNDQRLGTGTFDSLTINGNSQGIVTAPVTINSTDIPSAVFGVITGGGTITLRVEGSANLLLFSVPFSSTLYNATIT